MILDKEKLLNYIYYRYDNNKYRIIFNKKKGKESLSCQNLIQKQLMLDLTDWFLKLLKIQPKKNAEVSHNKSEKSSRTTARKIEKALKEKTSSKKILKSCLLKGGQI